MTDTYKAEVEAQGERFTVTFEKPEVITRMRLIGEMPDNLSDVSDKAVEEDEEVTLEHLEMEDLEWMHDVVDALPVESFMDMTEPAVKMVADDPPKDVTVDIPEDSEYTVEEVKEKL